VFIRCILQFAIEHFIVVEIAYVHTFIMKMCVHMNVHENWLFFKYCQIFI